MAQHKPLKGQARQKMIAELHRHYSEAKSLSQKILYFRKTYTWLFVVRGAKLLKRILDIFVSLILLIIIAPLLVLIALIIKATDGGSVLYLSTRVGLWGKEFCFPKFRSMAVGAEQLKKQLQGKTESKEQITFKMKKDPRVSWIGRILRRTSLDEMPQLWCVLKGEMSLVGPRPPLPEEVALYTLAQRRRLDTKPGLTCLWQVSGRSDIPFEKQVQMDLEYIQSQSLWLDLKILLKTIPAVLLGKGAY